MICARCHRGLISPEAIAAGMGEICRQKSAGLAISRAPSIKVRFLSRRPDGSRRWLAIDDQGKFIVGIFPDGFDTCECGATGKDPCRHIQAVLEYEAERLER